MDDTYNLLKPSGVIVSVVDNWQSLLLEVGRLGIPLLEMLY